MKVAFWIWTVFCVIGVAGTIRMVQVGKIYDSSNVTLKTSEARQLMINADESVTIEAASGNFFALRRPSGETIVGTLMQKPLGCDGEEYFIAEPIQVQGGEWIVEKGSDITIHLSSLGNMTVQDVMQSGVKTILSIFIGVVVFIIWIAVCVLVGGR